MRKIAFLLVGTLILTACQQQVKTAYVDNDILRQNFEVLQSNNKTFITKQNRLDSILQTEVTQFQKEVQAFQQKAQSMSTADREARRQALLTKQQQLQRKHRFQRSLLTQQEQKTRDSLEKIVKKTVKEYAQTHNYTYIFGANTFDNLLYADESKNITQDILSKLNGKDTEKASKKSTKKEEKDSPNK